MSETVISSFILRFTQETEIDAPWRGVVRHVQSDEETRFTRIDEALRFIGRFVDVVETAPGVEHGYARTESDEGAHLMGFEDPWREA